MHRRPNSGPDAVAVLSKKVILPLPPATNQHVLPSTDKTHVQPLKKELHGLIDQAPWESPKLHQDKKFQRRLNNNLNCTMVPLSQLVRQTMLNELREMVNGLPHYILECGAQTGPQRNRLSRPPNQRAGPTSHETEQDNNTDYQNNPTQQINNR